MLILAIGAFLSALVDAAAFGLLYPFIQLLTNSSVHLSSSAERITSDVFFSDVRHTLEVRLGVTILVLFVLSSVLGIALTYAQSRVAAASEAEVSIRLFGRYLRAPMPSTWTATPPSWSATCSTRWATSTRWC